MICPFCISPDETSSSDRLSSFFVPIKEQRKEETSGIRWFSAYSSYPIAPEPFTRMVDSTGPVNLISRERTARSSVKRC
jgi:hypothetical protein